MCVSFEGAGDWPVLSKCVADPSAKRSIPFQTRALSVGMGDRNETTIQSDTGEALRRKRKTRGQRACEPCRQRKVKCDYETPCKTCVDRNHPDLCLYQLPSKRVNVGSAGDSLPNTDDDIPSRAEWGQLCAKLNSFDQSLQELRKDLRRFAPGDQPPSAGGKLPLADLPSRSLTSNAAGPSPQGIHTGYDLTGETVHLGGNSVPAMVVALGSGSDLETVQELAGKSILPLFGLDNESATYPFVDLWGLPHGSSSRIHELCKLLPGDADCLQFFRQYRDTAHVLYPGLVDIRQFESDLTYFLVQRASALADINSEPPTEQSVYGKSLHWVGLLFATLASGCQCSETPRKERQLTCQVYGEGHNMTFVRHTLETNILTVCCAYECLRIINYLSHSTLVDIQNLLLLGNVISNNMNAGVAWSLLGIPHRTSCCTALCANGC